MTGGRRPVVHFQLHRVRVGREGDPEWRQGVSDGVSGKFTHAQLDDMREVRLGYSVREGRREESVASRAIEPFFDDGKWRNRVATEHVFSRRYDTREEAAAAGRQLARAANVEHIVRNIDGIAEREPHAHNLDHSPE